MRPEKNTCIRMRGFSLVELLVAITLGAIILAGAVTLFVNNQDTYKTTNALSRLQETARYALDMIVTDIRMAGHFGCADRPDTVNNATSAAPNTLADSSNPIEGFEAGGAWQPSTAAAPAGTLAGTDGITLRYLGGSMVDRLPTPPVLPCTGPGNCIPDHQVMAPAQNPVPITITVDAAADDFIAGQILAISNCGGTDIFRVNATAPNPTTLVTNDTLNRDYVPTTSTSMLAPYIGVRYFIANSLSGSGPSLFRSSVDPGTLNDRSDELFEGIESLQLLYGEDTNADGTPDNYANAAVVGNWQNVVSVRIGMLVRTVDERGQDPNTQIYTVNDVNLGPFGDRRQRRVFTTTAMVRN